MLRPADIVRTSHCARTIGALLVTGLLSSGCADEFAPPDTRAACFAQAGSSGGGGDAGSIWDVAFPGDSRTTNEYLTIYVCVAVSGPATVTAEAPEGVEVEPDPMQIADGRQDVETIRVGVTGGEGGSLVLTLDAQGDGGSVVLDVVVDGDEWSLERQ